MDQTIARCRRVVTDIATARLPAARSEDDLVSLLAEVTTCVERTVRERRDEHAPVPACGPGCSTCCVLNVATLPVEGAAIAGFLRRALGGAEAHGRAAGLASFADRVRWLEDRERAAHRLTCRFLDERGACSIYPVRPLACRGATSLDAADCRAALDGDEDEGVVCMDTLQKSLYDEARLALVEVLERLGLDARRRDVSLMAAVFLGDEGLVGTFLGKGRLPLG